MPERTEIAEAIEALGDLVSDAGGEGYEALGVLKDVAIERDELRAKVNTRIQDKLDFTTREARRLRADRDRYREALQKIESRTSSDDLEGWQALLICREALNGGTDA